VLEGPLPSSPARVRLAPLGGLGEIGMNCLAIEQETDILVVDCGIRFPRDDLGVDVVHPDFNWLVERADRIRGVFITHGHEDHIGGLPYLLRSVDVPVWGPPHAIGLVKHRLLDHGEQPDEYDLRLAHAGARYSVGSFDVEPIRVAHSIVEASALRISTGAGTILHTGDFNFDPDPPDGEPTDEARLASIGRDGVSLLLSDSTNVDVFGQGGSERAVGRALEGLIRAAPARVFIALFASNIQRLMLIGEIARSTGRKILLLGRSLTTQIEIAKEIGRLRWQSDLLAELQEAKTASPSRILVLAGGTQGERGSAMARLAAGTHPDIAIDPEDTVIFSSRTIPGNDIPVAEMTDGVLRIGARLHTRVTDPGIHTSGHATRGEQEKMLDLMQPRCFLPVHGTLHHLQRHGALARERGVAEVLVVENGTSVLCDGSSIRAEGRFTSGIVPVGSRGIELDSRTLRARAELARYGAATVALAIDRRGALRGAPSIVTRGIANMDDPSESRALKGAIGRALEHAQKRRFDVEGLREEVRRAVRRELYDIGGTKPVVDVLIVEEE
jgi:ribonuclease J